MSEKQVKRIRKHTKEAFGYRGSKALKQRYKQVKKSWNKAPRNQRALYMSIIMGIAKLPQEMRDKL